MDDIFDRLDEIDPEAPRLAFEGLLPELVQIKGRRRTNTDLHKAIIVAATVGRAVRTPEVRAEFARLPAECFDIAHVDRLETIAQATWYAYANLQHVEPLHTRAKLPPTLLAEATAVKQRMLKVLAYNLDHLDDVNLRLADIRARRAHLDLAYSLRRLAAMYQEHAGALAADGRRYRADDAAAAGRLALDIQQVLGDGMPSEARTWAAPGRCWSPPTRR